MSQSFIINIVYCTVEIKSCLFIYTLFKNRETQHQSKTVWLLVQLKIIRHIMEKIYDIRATQANLIMISLSTPSAINVKTMQIELLAKSDAVKI